MAEPPGARFEYGLKPYAEQLPYASGLPRRLLASGDGDGVDLELEPAAAAVPTRNARSGELSVAAIGDSLRAGRALTSAAGAGARLY